MIRVIFLIDLWEYVLGTELAYRSAWQNTKHSVLLTVKWMMVGQISPDDLINLFFAVALLLLKSDVVSIARERSRFIPTPAHYLQ